MAASLELSLLKYRLARHWTPELVSDVYRISGESLSTVFTLARELTARDESIEDRIEKADKEPLSGWDAEAYAFFRREGDEGTPLLGLKLLLKEVLFDEIWWKIVEAVTPQELDEL